MPKAPSLVIPGRVIELLESGGIMYLRYDEDVSENAWTAGIHTGGSTTFFEGDSPYTIFSALLQEVDTNGKPG